MSDKLSAMTPDAALAATSPDLLDYVADDARQHALQELARTQAVGYFLPLVHELFNGTEAKARVMFCLLYDLMIDERVRWTRAELDETFYWLKEGQRSYLLHRLSNVGWLEYYRDQGTYMLSDKGEALMRVLSRFTLGPELVQNEGTALAEIEFSLMLELEDLPQRLLFLRNRLMKHAIRAEHALASDSAYRILEVYQQLSSAYRWAEQTRETLDHVELADDNDAEKWTAVRGVHDHLSQLHSLIARMQLVLQDIQRRQIDIARYGLTHLDFDNYLIHTPTEHLAQLLRRHLKKVPHPFFLMEDRLFAEARTILGREGAPPEERIGWETTVAEPGSEVWRELPAETEDFARDLGRTGSDWQPGAELMREVSWEVAAYRFSLLTLLADLNQRSRHNLEAIAEPLSELPIEVRFDKEGRMVSVESNGETRTMTAVRLRRPVPGTTPGADHAPPQTGESSDDGC